MKAIDGLRAIRILCSHVRFGPFWSVMLDADMQPIQARRQKTETEKWAIIAYTIPFYNMVTKRLAYGMATALEERFGLSSQAIRDIMNEYFLQINDGNIYPDLQPKRKQPGIRSGPPSDLTPAVRDCILEFNSMEGYALPVREFVARFNLVYGTTFSRSTMHHYMKQMRFKLRNSFVKPKLRDQHRVLRLQWILNRMEPLGDGDYRFNDLSNVVHIDEKWFYVTRAVKSIREHPDEPRHKDDATQHKSHIEKVMFLAAVGVPQYRPDGSFFDGKICMLPVVEEVVAQRNSVNRPAGTVELRPKSIDASTYFDLLAGEGGVMQHIRAKMGWLQDVGVVIQHDGAGPHNGKGNNFFLPCAGHEHELPISIETQPAQSPDLNKLDLCLFNGLDKRAHLIKGNGNTVNELVEAVAQAWEDYPHESLTRVHGLLLETYRWILLDKGNNQYKVPHSHIRSRQTHGQNPIDDFVPMDVRLVGVEALDLLLNPEDDISDDEDSAEEEEGI